MKNRDQTNEDFCNALIQNNWEGLKNIINPFLITLDTKQIAEENYDTFKTWIEKHDCVQTVEISTDFLDSDPPIKEFYVTLNTSAQKIVLGIKVTQTKFILDYK